MQRIESPEDEPEFGYTWEQIMRERGYSDEVIRTLAAKRAAKHASFEED